MRKQFLQSYLLLVISLFFSAVTQACTISPIPKELNFGTIKRDALTIESNDQAKLNSKTFQIQLTCNTADKQKDISLTFKGATHANGNFLFGNHGYFLIEINNFMLDSVSQVPIVRRNGAVINAAKDIKPNDRLEPPAALGGGKQLLVELKVTPVLVKQDLYRYGSNQYESAIEITAPNSTSEFYKIKAQTEPISCTPSVESNGQVYYQVRHNQLSETQPTVLPATTLNLVIQCTGTTNVAMNTKSLDNKTPIIDAGGLSNSGAARPHDIVMQRGLGKNLPLNLPNLNAPNVAGLTDTATNNSVGGYMLVIPRQNIYLDNDKATTRYRTTTTPTENTVWENQKQTPNPSYGDSMYPFADAYYAFGSNPSAPSPQPFRTLNAMIVIQPYITAKKNLDLSAPINFRGTTRIELYYY